jgi:hypothetical protein
LEDLNIWKNNKKNNFKATVYEDMYWIHLVQNKVQLLHLEGMKMNLQVPKKLLSL